MGEFLPPESVAAENGSLNQGACSEMTWVTGGNRLDDPHRDMLTKTYLGFAPPLLLFTLVGSPIIISVMLKQVPVLSGAIYFIVLAAADMTYMISSALGAILRQVGVNWIESDFGCAAVPIAIALGRTLASVAITLIAIERSLMLVNPARFASFARPIVATILSVIAAVVILASQLPLFWAWEYHPVCKVCYVPRDEARLLYVYRNAWCLYTVGGFFAFFISLICCFVMAWRLFTKRRALARDPVHQQHQSSMHSSVAGGRKFSLASATSRRMNRVNVVVLLLVTSFVVLMLPLNVADVILLTMARSGITDEARIGHNIAVILTYICHGCRLLVFVIGSPTFRNQAATNLWSFFCCHWGKETFEEKSPGCCGCIPSSSHQSQQTSLRKGQWVPDQQSRASTSSA